MQEDNRLFACVVLGHLAKEMAHSKHKICSVVVAWTKCYIDTTRSAKWSLEYAT